MEGAIVPPALGNCWPESRCQRGNSAQHLPPPPRARLPSTFPLMLPLSLTKMKPHFCRDSVSAVTHGPLALTQSLTNGGHLVNILQLDQSLSYNINLFLYHRPNCHPTSKGELEFFMFFLLFFSCSGLMDSEW